MSSIGTASEPVAIVVIGSTIGGQAGGGSVLVAHCAYDAIGLRWRDADTLEITHPAAATLEKQDHSWFFFGRAVQCVYRQ